MPKQPLRPHYRGQMPLGRRVHPHLRAYPPAAPPSGPSGGSDASQEPIFEFTFETEIKKRKGGYAPHVYGQTTITVRAKDHEAAKAKVNAALGEAPANEYGTTYERIFRFGGVREV